MVMEAKRASVITTFQPEACVNRASVGCQNGGRRHCEILNAAVGNCNLRYESMANRKNQDLNTNRIRDGTAYWKRSICGVNENSDRTRFSGGDQNNNNYVSESVDEYFHLGTDESRYTY